jgi:hypothetical protein
MKVSLVASTRSPVWIIALGLGCAGFLPAAQVQASDDLPPGVREQLQKNAAAMSAVHLEYSRTREQVQATALPKAEGQPTVTTFSDYFDAGRFYQRSLWRDGRQVGECAWDGKFYYLGSPDTPGDSLSSIMKFTADNSGDSDRNRIMIDTPYLIAAGYFRARALADLAKPSVQSLVLHDMGESVKTRIEQVGDKLRITVLVSDPELVEARHIDLNEERRKYEGGRNSPELIAKEMKILEDMQKMEPKRTIAFLLDSRYGYGVIEREEWTAAGKRIAHLVAEEWKHYDGADVWLPTRCTESSFMNSYTNISDRPVSSLTLQLKKVEFGPQGEVTFSLDKKANYKKPGSAITDRTSTKEVSYRVAADQETLLKVAEEAPLRDSSWVWFWVKVNLAVLGVFGIAFLIFWRVRRARARLEPVRIVDLCV